ncbi:MAG: toxin-antitoxin system TumE family protein [Chloroflexota bacterium]
MAGARAFVEGWIHLLEELGTTQIRSGTAPADDAGILQATISLPGKCRLSVYIRLEISDDPRLLTYSLQLTDQQDNTLLRYDNASHHKELPGAPHHLHRGDAVFPVIPEPSLRVMLAAIRDELDRRRG